MHYVYTSIQSTHSKKCMTSKKSKNIYTYVCMYVYMYVCMYYLSCVKNKRSTQSILSPWLLLISSNLVFTRIPLKNSDSKEEEVNSEESGSGLLDRCKPSKSLSSIGSESESNSSWFMRELVAVRLTRRDGVTLVFILYI